MGNCRAYICGSVGLWVCGTVGLWDWDCGSVGLCLSTSVLTAPGAPVLCDNGHGDAAGVTVMVTLLV